jgi:proteic killer suppression protein
MILAFQTEKLRAICEDPAAAAKEFGTATAAQLRGRLADLRAATGTGDLLVGNPRFAGELDQYLIIDVGGEATMTWTPNHVTPRTTQAGGIDWICVTRVQLLKIEVNR